MNLLGGGLLGMGGLNSLLGNAPASNMTIAQLFDPASMRNSQLKRGLLNAGIALMNPDPKTPPSFGASIGRAMSGGLQGADQAKQDYINNGMLSMQLGQMQKEQDSQAAQTKAINDLIPTLPPDIQSFARAFPDKFAEAFAKAKMDPTAAKAPTMETLYDEKTGQPYKGQWNPTTQKWERVGGNKADENGITITNPDGTTTQIGGSGTKTTEADRRAKLLIEQLAAQEPQLMAGFDSLATAQNSIGAGTGAPGRAVMTGEAQVAKDSLRNVVANWLYLVSGATANPGEVDTQVAMITPSYLDKPETIAAKKARLQSILDTMKMRVGMPAGSAAQPQQQQPSSDGWTTLPNGVRIRQVH